MSGSSSGKPIHIYRHSSRLARNICSRMQVSESRSSECSPPCRGTNAGRSRELKETISKLHEAQEQLTLITAERDELAKSSQEHEDLSDTVRRLREELKAASEKPAATVMREPTAEEIKQYTVDAIEKERAKAKKDKEKAIAEAVERARDEAKKSVSEELEKKYKAVLDAAEKEKSELTGRLEKVEKDAKLTASPEVAKFSVYFDSIQKYINVMRGIIASMDDATTAAKLRDAMQKLGALLQEV